MAAILMRRHWFSIQGALDAPFRLFCFPFAGGGTAPFSGWAHQLGRVELWAARLPGRESRLDEEPFYRLGPLVRALADVMPADADRPFLFFGHSMGALTSFELARELRRRGLPSPAHLFVSGRQAPHLPDPEPPLHHLSLPEFAAHVGSLGATPPEIVQEPELRDLFLPSVRADFAVCETYAHTTEPPLECGITAYGGAADTTVPRHHLELWRDHTTGVFRLHIFPGDHFFISSDRAAVLRTLSSDIAQMAPSIASPGKPG